MSTSSRLSKTVSNSPFFHAQPHPGTVEEEEEPRKYRDSLDGVSWVEDDWQDYEDVEDVLNATSQGAPMEEASQSSPSLRLVGAFHDHGPDDPTHASSNSSYSSQPYPPRDLRNVPREAVSSMQANKGSVAPESPSSPSNRSFMTAMDAPETPVTATHKYHYLHRSESSLTYPPKPNGVYSNHLYNQAHASSLHQLGNNPTPSPLRSEFVDDNSDSDDDQDITEVYSTARRGQLSPIDESEGALPAPSHSSPSPRKDNDAASLHSFVSSQTLFINRQLNVSRIRPSPSVSSFTSTRSSPLPNSTRNGANDPTPNSTGYDADADSPFPPRKPLRSFSHLPIIPASPRVSRNVTEGTGTTLPYTSHKNGTQSLFNYDDFPMPPTSDRNETMSLVSQSESVQTELTYLTAQDSIVEEARTPNDNRRSRHSAAFPLASPLRKSSKPTLSARGKASARTLLLKSRILTLPTQKLIRGLKQHVPDFTSVPTKWRNGEPGPAEILFWMGFFLGPWCWLIGGLPPRDGNNGANASESETQPTGIPGPSNSPLVLPLWRSGRAPAADDPGLFKKAMNSLGISSGSRTQVASTTLNPPSQPEKSSNKPDPWILRCRIAAMISAILMITVMILAIIVLSRSL